MKQTYPLNRGNQLSGNKLQRLSADPESGTWRDFYRSIILAVSGSLICVAAGENAAGQSSDAAPQTPSQMLSESAEASSPASFAALHAMETTQWPLQSLEPADGTLICYDAGNSPIWHPAEKLELFYWNGSANNANAPAMTLLDAPPNAGSAPAAGPQPPAVSAAPGTPGATIADADANSNPNQAVPAMLIQPPSVHKNEVDASANFMYGRGTVTVPIGYAFQSTDKSFPATALSADRSTVYYGGTISYSYLRSWFIDFSAQNGRSTGSTPITIPGGGALPNISVPGDFNINDTWYQIYLRYNFKNFLAGTPYSAYVRGGVSLVEATLTTVNSAIPSGQKYAAGGLYSENDNTFDVLGQLGFGLTRALPSTVRLKTGLQLEGEGFGGNRSQDITEEYVPSSFSANTTINDTVYGALGRLTFHADYKLSARWKLTADVGMMVKYSFVTYPGIGTKDELLYGPYAKVGAGFVF